MSIAGIQFDKRVTLGNLVSWAGIVGLAAAAVVHRDGDVVALKSSVEVHESRIGNVEKEVQKLNTTTAAAQQNLDWIKQTLTEIKSDLHEVRSKL